MKLSKYLLTSLSLVLSSTLIFGQEGDDAAAASSTGSVSAPSKGAPKSAQANHKLRVLHIAIHKLGYTHESLKALDGGLDTLKDKYTESLKSGGSIKDFKMHHDLLVTGIGIHDAKEYGDLLRKGHSLDDAELYADFLRDPEHEGKSLEDTLAAAKAQHADQVADPLLLINDAELLALSRYASTYSKDSQFTSALTLASTVLTDRVLTTTLPASTISVASLSATGYNTAFIRLLSAYGALGSNGENLASNVLGANYSYTGDSTLSSLVQNSTSDYLGFLSTLTGSRSFSTEDTPSSVLNVPLSNVMLKAGSTLTLGQTGSESTIDVSNELGKAASTADRKVLVIGAAKDLKSAGNIKFTNSNTVEDHALVLGAADDVFIENTNIEYTGSNLGIGSGDTGSDSMYLVNTSISTGGNLAVGSLGTMNITGGSTFTVGTANGSNSDPDNVYLYANELINIDRLNFSGRIDDIYMESKTIHIKNTSFPSTADIMLRSQNGALSINNSDNKSITSGAVNFHNVKHLGISNDVLTRNQFNGVDGHINSAATLPNGTPFIKVRGQ